MRAVRLWGPRDVRVEDIADVGQPPPGWVSIRVEMCGICGTDVEEYRDGPNVVPTAPHPLTGASVPLVLGHEAVGVVENAGDGVALRPGTRVAVEANMYCGECWACERGFHQLCEKQASLGIMADGGLAERMLAPAYTCIAYDARVPSKVMALAEPLSVVVRAIRRSGIELGRSVGIVGAGTIGLLAVQVARLAGARHIVVAEQIPGRRRLAEQLGADVAIGPDEAVDAAREENRGAGLDIVIEVAGNPAAASTAVKMTRAGGRTVLLGVYSGRLEVDMMDLLLKEKTVTTSLSHVIGDFADAVALLEVGRIDTEPIVSDVIGLDAVVSGGFEALLLKPEDHLKILVTPDGALLGEADVPGRPRSDPKTSS